MTPDDLDFLASPVGARLLERLAGEDLSDDNALRLLTSLRRDYSPAQAGAALEIARLRVKATAKFGADAVSMWFTRDALEQASDPLIRHYRGQMAAAGRVVFDLCCGIGSDALAFAAHDAQVTGIDLDPVRVAMGRLNAAALGLKVRFEVGDVAQFVPPAQADLLFFDPARRDADGERLHHVEAYLPPLSLAKRWRLVLRDGRVLVKLSPGVDLRQLEAYRGTIEFISVAGDLKEALLCLPADAPPGLSTAALLLTQDGAHRWDRADDDAPLDAPRAWLVEPDPSLIRAGRVQSLAAELNGALLDETIAYFTTDTPPHTPWARAWRILDWMPFSVKKLRAYLRERGVGSVTVKKRGTAVTPDSLIPQLKLKGDGSRTLVLTRSRGAQIVLVCEDIGREVG